METMVVDKRDNKVYQVYDIAYNKVGYPVFLIYKDNQWLRVSAKHFSPCTAEKYLSEVLFK